MGQSSTIALLALSFFGCSSSSTYSLDTFGQLPQFSMESQSGATVTHQAFQGKVTVINFIFTRCPGVCPSLSAKMQSFQKATAGDPQPPTLISFSVDPEYDTPERLAEYANRFQADPTRWYFLRGNYQQIADIATKGFSLLLEKKGEAPADIIHSDRFVLLDKSGTIRGYYLSTDKAALKKLIRDTRWLSEQKP